MIDAPLTPETLRELAKRSEDVADRTDNQALQMQQIALAAILREAADLWAQSLLIGSRVEQEKKKTVTYDREYAHATFNGGWHGNEDGMRAFHHGMDTVFNLIDAGAIQRIADLESQLLSTEQERDRLLTVCEDMVGWCDRLEAEQYEQTVLGQTLESAARNWETLDDSGFDMQPMREAVARSRRSGSSTQPADSKLDPSAQRRRDFEAFEADFFERLPRAVEHYAQKAVKAEFRAAKAAYLTSDPS